MTAPADLARRTTRGAVFMLGARGVGTASSIVATAVMARYISPAEYGVVGMVVAVLAIARVVEEFGLGEAAIQRDRITAGEISTLAIVNSVLGLVLMLLFAAASPLIAWFYDRPELVPVCLSLAPMFLFAGLGAQPRALLRREFRFRPLAIAQASSLAIAATVGMVGAIAGLGIWALVLQNLAGGIALAAGSWIGARWIPRDFASWSRVRPMLGYGANLGASQLLNALTRNLDDILIGRFVGAAAVGAYGRAFQLMTLPSSQLNQPLTSAVVPALSRLQNDPEGFRRMYRGAIEVIASVAFPLAVFIGVAAPAFVGTVLGPAWAESVPILRALSPVGLMVSLNVATGWVYISLGRTDRQLRWRILGSCAAILGMVAGLPWGAIGVALGLSCARVVMRLPAVLYCFHGTPLRLRDLGSVVWRTCIASAVAGPSAWSLEGLELAAPLVLLLQAGVFAAVWCGIMLLIPGGRARIKAGAALVRSVRGKESTRVA